MSGGVADLRVMVRLVVVVASRFRVQSLRTGSVQGDRLVLGEARLILSSCLRRWPTVNVLRSYSTSIMVWSWGLVDGPTSLELIFRVTQILVLVASLLTRCVILGELLRSMVVRHFSTEFTLVLCRVLRKLSLVLVVIVPRPRWWTLVVMRLLYVW